MNKLLSSSFLQYMQNLFSLIMDITVCFVDSEGKAFTEMSGKRTTTDGESVPVFHHSVQSRSSGVFPLAEGGEGQVVGVAPLNLRGEYQGSWILGPVDGEDRSAVKRLELATEYIAAVNGGFTDISDNKKKVEWERDRLEISRQVMEVITGSAGIYMCLADFATGEILTVNSKCAAFLAEDQEGLSGMNVNEVFSRAGVDLSGFAVMRSNPLLAVPDTPYVWEAYLPEKKMWLRLTAQSAQWVDGKPVSLLTFVDITKSKMMQDQLAQLAFYDREIELPNGLKLVRDLRELAADGGDLEKTHVICFDISSLRKINAVYSWEAGDMLLQSIKEWVYNLGIPKSELYRVEGDLFCFVVNGTSGEVAEAVARKIYQRFDDPWILYINGETTQIFCNVSMGIFSAGQFSVTENMHLNRIEQIMEVARREKTVVIYDEALDAAFQKQMRMEQSLKQCVREGMRGFDVHYQPIVDPRTGRWCGLEALCRWESPEFGSVPPQTFIEVAEQSGMIGALGRWVMDTAVRQCKQWRLDKLDGFILDVNLSPVQLMNDGLLDEVSQILQQYNYPGNRLNLEITESAQFDLSGPALEIVRRIRDMGIEVALDDFGTGYASFNNLKNLPVGILKTERAFISGIENDDYLQYLFFVMVELAHAADMKIIAEGVETACQMEILLHNGVDYIQGFLFSKPLPAWQMAKELARFYHSDPILVGAANGFDMDKLLDARNGYTLPPPLYRILNQCMQTLLEGGDASRGTAVEQALQVVGEFLKPTRISVFLWDPADKTYYRAHYWLDREAPGNRNLFKRFDPKYVGELNRMMRQNGGATVAVNLNQMPELLRDFYISEGVRSAVNMPMWEGELLKGFLSVADCEDPREWIPEEILLLYNLTMLFHNVLLRMEGGMEAKAPQAG